MSLASPFTNEVPCARCPLRQCEVFRKLSDEEIEFVQSLKTGELRMAQAPPCCMKASRQIICSPCSRAGPSATRR